MNSEEVLEMLKSVGAILADDHFMYTSGLHGSMYINKDRLYPHTQMTQQFRRSMATHFTDEAKYGIEVVAVPAVGGITLGTWTSHWLEQMTGRKALMVYAEKSRDGETLEFRRGYGELVKGRRVLLVDDILTTGSSVTKLARAVRALGGNILAAAVICNRGNVTAEEAGEVPELFALADVSFEAYAPNECPICKKGIPIKRQLGKGKELPAAVAPQ